MYGRWAGLSFSLWLCLGTVSAAEAQYDPEGGDVALPPPTSSGASSGPSGSPGAGGVRVGAQGRVSTVNVLGGDLAGFVAVPFITPGARLADGKLFLGLGFGFAGVKDGPSSFSFSPLFGFDLVDAGPGVFSLVGWLNFASYDDGGPIGGDAFAWGLNLGVGFRGRINEATAIGTEIGWGFLVIDEEPDFVHGVFGNVVFEATFGP